MSGGSCRYTGVHVRRLRRIAATLAVGLVSVLVAAPPGFAAGAPPSVDAANASGGDRGWFEAGLTWYGDFADPTIVHDGSTFYAYSSGAGGRYLGVQTSSDLRSWAIHRRWTNAAAPWAGGPDPRNDTQLPAEIRLSGLSAGDKWNENDALVRPAAWGMRVVHNAWYQRDYWGVGVGRIGTTWYAWAPVKVSDTLADGTRDPEGFGRYCLTMATARSPLGPFRDTSTGPWWCDGDPAGSIDPEPYTDPTTGRHYLTWKATGLRSRPGVQGHPVALRAVRLDATGHPTGAVTTLLTTNEGSWEGYSIENPSMIRFRGRWYLFYSGNSFRADRAGNSPYAVGYAICTGPLGPCRRPSATPLMRSTASQTGPGAASAFLDGAGRLRLVYTSYWPGEYRLDVSIHQPRRMHIALLAQATDGTVRRVG